jgi:hypothetical protein
MKLGMITSAKRLIYAPVGPLLTAIDALHIDPQEYIDAVASSIGDLGDRDSGTEPERDSNMAQGVRPIRQRRQQLRWRQPQRPGSCPSLAVRGLGGMSGLPETDVARVQRWCRARTPAHVRHEVRVEVDVADRHLTIVECRPPWRTDFGPEWTRFPIARLR